MIRRIVLTLILCISIGAIFSGCGNGEEVDTFNETTVSIDKKGHVSEAIVESFSKDYYDVSELEQEINDTVNAYNSQNGEGTVLLKSISSDGDTVNVNFDFASADDYKNFQNRDMFYGTVGEAYDAGYTMDVTLKGVQNGDKISKVGLMGMSDKHIIILSENVRLRAFRNIAYVSANVDVLSDKEVRIVNESGGLAYILLEK